MAILKSKFSLKGKVALITGGAGILGPVEAKILKQAGAKVILSDIDPKRLKDQAKKLKVDFFVLDVTSSKSLNKTYQFVKKKCKKLDILVNNAAATGLRVKNASASFEEQSLADWNYILNVNLTGVFLCSQKFSQLMPESGGNIINISSIYGLVGPDFRIYAQSKYQGKKMGLPAAYAASKAAIIGLTKYLACCWAEKNIRVNCITMGGVFDNQSKNFVKKYSQRVPLGRMANRQEIAGTILFLASEASSYVTGANIIVDGGLTVW